MVSIVYSSRTYLDSLAGFRNDWDLARRSAFKARDFNG